MNKTYTIDQTRDTGLAFVLLFLIIIYLTKSYRLLPLPIALLIITMTWPVFFRPFVRIWIGSSHVIGTVMSKIILAIIFFVIVTPVGMIRRVFGADPMRLKRWKKNDGSVFRMRNSKMEAKDLEQPY